MGQAAAANVDAGHLAAALGVLAGDVRRLAPGAGSCEGLEAGSAVAGVWMMELDAETSVADVVAGVAARAGVSDRYEEIDVAYEGERGVYDEEAPRPSRPKPATARTRLTTATGENYSADTGSLRPNAQPQKRGYTQFNDDDSVSVSESLRQTNAVPWWSGPEGAKALTSLIWMLVRIHGGDTAESE
jgi:hypothetical protein